MIDWIATHKNVIALLQTELLPWHYRQAYHKTVSFASGEYSNKTDPVEKFRQYYAEHYRGDVGFVKGGYLVLRSWFPNQKQLSLLSLESPRLIKGNCLVSYNAGFEQAMRQPHMFDHFGDANTKARAERRRRASLIETHVKNYFATNYQEFYRPPSNHLDFTKSAKEDFFLKLPEVTLPIDIKSWSFKRDDGRNEGVARNPSDHIVYLWADWQEQEENVLMYGVCSGNWLKVVGEQNIELTHITDNLIWHIDCLIVMLNMNRADLRYMPFRNAMMESSS